MYTFEQLSAFIAVYEQGSYSQAAKKLNKARTTIREQVMGYEDILGFSLFTIVGKKATATDNAKTLYLRAKLVDRQNQALLNYGEAFFDQECTELTLVHDVIVPTELLIYVEKKIAEHYPTTKVHWLHRNRDQAFDLIQENSVDLAFMSNRNAAIPELEIAYTYIGNAQMGIYTGPNSPLLDSDNIELADLQLEVQYLSENLAILNTAYADVSPHCNIVSNNDVLCAMLQQRGWSPIPNHIATPYVQRGELAEIKIKEISSEFIIGFNVFYSQRKVLNSTVQEVIHWSKDFCKIN
ncbi:LysR family transcriptional regulator [Colwelliaceae bacterium BS250]